MLHAHYRVVDCWIRGRARLTLTSTCEARYNNIKEGSLYPFFERPTRSRRKLSCRAFPFISSNRINHAKRRRFPQPYIDAQPTWKHIPLPIEGRIEAHTWNAYNPRLHHIMTGKYQYVFEIESTDVKFRVGENMSQNSSLEIKVQSIRAASFHENGRIARIEFTEYASVTPEQLAVYLYVFESAYRELLDGKAAVTVHNG